MIQIKTGQVWSHKSDKEPFVVLDTCYLGKSGDTECVPLDNLNAGIYPTVDDLREHYQLLANSIEEYYTKKLATPSCKACVCSSKSTKQ